MYCFIRRLIGIGNPCISLLVPRVSVHGTRLHSSDPKESVVDAIFVRIIFFARKRHLRILRVLGISHFSLSNLEFPRVFSFEFFFRSRGPSLYSVIAGLLLLLLLLLDVGLWFEATARRGKYEKSIARDTRSRRPCAVRVGRGSKQAR